MKKIFMTATVVLALPFFYFLLSGCNGSTPGPSDSDCGDDKFYGMNLSDFVQGVARYKLYHADPVSLSLQGKGGLPTDFQDARSCWYSLDTLKKFICLIEQYAAKDSIPPDSLGIRFYYGMYKNPMLVTKAYLGKPGLNYGGRHTLFMVPTRHTDDGDVDYDLKGVAATMLVRPNVSTENLTYVQARNIRMDSFSYANMIMAHRLSASVLILSASVAGVLPGQDKNQGKLCPPTCPPGPGSTLQMVDAQSSTTPVGINF